MSDARPGVSRLAWWAVGCVAGGWLIVYNVLRLGGDYPSEAATPALVGAAGGAVAFVAGLLVMRRLAASGTRFYARPSPADEPAVGAHAAWRAAAVVLLAAAAVALVVGLLMARDYVTLSSPRPRSTLLLMVWDIVFALWVGEEAVRVLRAPGLGDVDPTGFDAVWFAGLLTCVLAGVAFSRDLFPALQVVLVALAGVASAAVAVALWRHRGHGGVPLGALGALVLAALSIALPALI